MAKQYNNIKTKRREFEMKKSFSRILCIFLSIQFMLSVFAPVTIHANDATMIEALIEPNTKTYKVEVVSDTHGWFGGHYETKHWNFGQLYRTSCKTSYGKSVSTLSDDDFVKALIANPNLCMDMDATITGYGTSNGDLTGYNFFLKAEGYKIDGGDLVNDDDKIQDVKKKEATAFQNKNNLTGKAKDEGLKALTFPGAHGGGAKDATTAETEYAISVGNVLADSLNGILSMINNGKRYTTQTELINKSILIRPTKHGYTIVDTGTDKSYVIVYATLDSALHGSKWQYIKKENHTQGNPVVSGTFSASTLSNADYPNADNEGNLLAYVIPVNTKDSNNVIQNLTYGGVSNSQLLWEEMAVFSYAVPKGYIKIDSVDGSLQFTNEKQEAFAHTKEGKDVPWITIHHISMYANNAFKNHNITMSTKNTADEKGNWFMAIIAEFFNILLSGLRTVLGLSDTHTLIYNKGARASAAYNYGVMADSWWTVVLRYHLIFQSIAWFILICAFIKVLIDLNLSTINPSKKVHAFDTIQRFVICGFLLVTIIPIIQFMLNMNNSIVQIFASQVDPNAAGAPVIGSLAGIVLQLCYFGITVYINFTYIMRSIIIGILTVTAPFFIASLAFSPKNQGLVTNWFKELTANIFMQSVHAFSFAFLTNLMTTGGGLESLVISYSIIPLTELIRSLIFGSAGGATESLGKAAGNRFTTAATSLASAGANAVAGKISEKMGGGAETDERGNKEGAGSGSGNSNAGGGKSANNVAKLEKAVSDRADAKKGGALGKEGKTTASDRRTAAAQDFKKAAMNAGNVIGKSANLMSSLASMQLTGDTNASFVGESAVGIAADAGKMVGNAVEGGGQMAKAAQQDIQTSKDAKAAGQKAYDRSMQQTKKSGKPLEARQAQANQARKRAIQRTKDRANAGTPTNMTGTRVDSATNQRVSTFTSNAGGSFSNVGNGTVRETFSANSLKNMDASNPDANFYNAVARAAEGS